MIGREHVPNIKAELFAGGGVFVVEDPGAPVRMQRCFMTMPFVVMNDAPVRLARVSE